MWIHVNIFQIYTVCVCIYIHYKYTVHTHIYYTFILDVINHFTALEKSSSKECTNIKILVADTDTFNYVFYIILLLIYYYFKCIIIITNVL